MLPIRNVIILFVIISSVRLAVLGVYALEHNIKEILLVIWVFPALGYELTRHSLEERNITIVLELGITIEILLDASPARSTAGLDQEIDHGINGKGVIFHDSSC